MVPDGWELKKLGDLGNKKKPAVKAGPFGSALKKEFYVERGYKIYGQEQVIANDAAYGDYYISEEKYSSLKSCAVEPGDILISLVGTVGKVLLLEDTCEAGIINPRLLRISVSKGKVFGSFLKYFLETEKTVNTLLSWAQGGTMGVINAEMVKQLPILIPPFPEQKKISQILSTWNKAITATEQLLANSQQQKKALMQQLLTCKKRLLDRNGVRFSEEWKSYSLGDWIHEYTEKSIIDNQHEVLTSSRSGLVKQSEYFADSRISQRENLGFNVLPPGYITYRSRSDDGLFFFNRNDFSFTGIISTYYPVFHFPDGDSSFFINFLNRNASAFAGYSVGTSQKVLSLNALKSIKVKLPDKEEQQKIAVVLSTADQEITALQQKLDALKHEKKALMQQLLTGKRRVITEEAN